MRLDLLRVHWNKLSFGLGVVLSCFFFFFFFFGVLFYLTCSEYCAYSHRYMDSCSKLFYKYWGMHVQICFFLFSFLIG
jgi:amino acid permease